MPETLAALFRNRLEAEEGLRKLKEAGFGEDQVSVSTPRVGRRGHYGMKVLAGIAGQILATFLFAAVAGAATGGVAGALLIMAASGDTTLYYDEEVESGRVLVSVAGPGLAEAREILLAAGAMEAAPVEAPLPEERGRPRPEGG
jgi:hypothetical protein